MGVLLITIENIINEANDMPHNINYSHFEREKNGGPYLVGIGNRLTALLR